MYIDIFDATILVSITQKERAREINNSWFLYNNKP